MKASRKIGHMMRQLGVGHTTAHPTTGEPMTLQTIIFHKDAGWDVRKAKSWLREHYHGGLYPDRKTTTIHFRQREPSEFDITSFRAKKIGNGITLVLGHLK